MADQSEYEGWSHVFLECCRSEKEAGRKPCGDKDDLILAFLDVKRAVTFCFRKEVRFHDEWMYQLRRVETSEGWTHELWECCRFEDPGSSDEERARWERHTDNTNPILACIDVEGDVTFYFRDKVRVHNRRIYRFRPLNPG